MKQSGAEVFQNTEDGALGVRGRDGKCCRLDDGSDTALAEADGFLVLMASWHDAKRGAPTPSVSGCALWSRPSPGLRSVAFRHCKPGFPPHSWTTYLPIAQALPCNMPPCQAHISAVIDWLWLCSWNCAPSLEEPHLDKKAMWKALTSDIFAQRLARIFLGPTCLNNSSSASRLQAEQHFLSRVEKKCKPIAQGLNVKALVPIGNLESQNLSVLIQNLGFSSLWMENLSFPFRPIWGYWFISTWDLWRFGCCPQPFFGSTTVVGLWGQPSQFRKEMKQFPHRSWLIWFWHVDEI